MKIRITNTLVSIFLLLSVFGETVVWCADTAPPNTANTRKDQLRRKRQEKLPQLKPEKISGPEHKLYTLETALESGVRLNYKGIYPKWTSLTGGSGFAPGVRYWHPQIRETELDIQGSAAYSIRGYQLYEFQFGKIERKSSEFFLNANHWGGYSQAPRIPSLKRTYYLYSDFYYRHFPREAFFGIGPDSLEKNRTDYLLTAANFEGVAGIQFNSVIGAGFRAGLMRPDISDGTDRRFPDTTQVFNNQSAPGLLDQPDFLTLSSSVFVDYRDVPGNPHKGTILGVAFSRFDDRKENKFDFNRFAFDGRGYLPLGSDQRILALRFFSSFDDPSRGSEVPFYLMETLGGSETLRGFHRSRFRDKNLMYLSGEYRWEGAPGLELALFYDTGKVFPDRSDFGFNHLEKSWGFGVRLKSSNSVFLRIDYGHSNEGDRIIIKFGPSF